MRDDLSDGRSGDGVLIDRRRQIACNEIASAGAHLRYIQPGGGLLRDQRAQIPRIDQFADRGLIGDVGEERVLPLVQHPAIEPERRGG